MSANVRNTQGSNTRQNNRISIPENQSSNVHSGYEHMSHSTHKAWLCYNTVYCPIMACSLGTTSLMARQIDTLHTLVMPQILPQMGYQRNFTKVVVYGSKYAG
eukprot:5277835-Ditylum_brightwellii.AAC.1